MKRKWKVTSVCVVWALLALLNYGAMNAQSQWDRHNRYPILHYKWRDDLGIDVMESCLLPPVQLLVVALITNFYQHGWTLSTAD